MTGTNTEDGDGEPPEQAHIVRRVGAVVLWVALLVGLVAAAAVAIVPALTGARAMTVLSGSMEPALPVGAVVVARETPAEQIAVGDVITYTDRDPDSPATRVVTHRVIGVVQEPGGLAFATQGDANNAPDPGTTAAADVIGVQWYAVPWVGTIRESLTGPVGLSYAAGILLLILSAHLLLPRTASVSAPETHPAAETPPAPSTPPAPGRPTAPATPPAPDSSSAPNPTDAPTQQLPWVAPVGAPPRQVPGHPGVDRGPHREPPISHRHPAGRHRPDPGQRR